jgi:hypothetical protein
LTCRGLSKWSRRSLHFVNDNLFLDLKQQTKNLSDSDPLFPRDRFSILVVQINSIHKLPINVELLMECSTIADADRFALLITRKMTVSRELDTLSCLPKPSYLSSISGI